MFVSHILIFKKKKKLAIRRTPISHCSICPPTLKVWKSTLLDQKPVFGGSESESVPSFSSPLKTTFRVMHSY